MSIKEPIAAAKGTLPGPLAFAIVAAWFASILYLGSSGAFTQRAGPLHPVQVAIFAPIILFLFVYLMVAPVRRFIAALDIAFLVGFQGVRVLALSHINMWGYGLMAGGFALPVGLANLAVCMLALATIPAVANRTPGWRGKVIVLSVLGLAEFAMTIALAVLGFLAEPMPFDPPVAPGGYADFRHPPLGLFPTFAIPFLSIVHVATLLRLRGEPRQ